MKENVIIIGAGLCGTLLALRLAQRGFNVEVFERRPDMRKTGAIGGRSINLALSDRGIKGLNMAGISEDIIPLVIPMVGRMIHPVDGQSTLVNYSGRKGEWINSVSRGGLNMLLLDKAEKTGNVIFNFNTECSHVDLESGNSIFKNNSTSEIIHRSGNIIFGTDGSNSVVRNTMLDQSVKLRFDYSLQYLETAYKELQIPPQGNGDFRLEKNALHIWPRHGFMMIALPNLDGSFTVTLFLPFEGEYSFSNLKEDTQILDFFKTHFASAMVHMPDLLNDFKNNPTSALATVKCFPWQVNGKFLLMGDAAHAVVPFYGQGMNASFEDVFVLDQYIDLYNGDWTKILPAYQANRKKDTDAIADLAVENQFEMRDATANPVFMLKRKIELQLEQNYTDYYSKYSMVTFREDVPYSQAMAKGRQQDAILMEYAGKILNTGEIDLPYIYDKLKNI